ncbi:MAG: pectinesterase family protein [Candidatus Coproplasma sp.]
MNKRLTKLLSVFVIAGAIGTGTAVGLVGCKKEPTHTHTASTEWQNNDTDHWHNCTANDGEEMDKAPHSYGGDLDADCDVCGYVRTVTYSITYAGLEGITGTNTNPTSYTNTGSAITLVAVEKENYTFDGWYNGDTKVTTIATGTTGNLTLTAKWKAKTFRISYTGLDGISGTNDNPTTYTIESDTITLKPVAKEGCIFDGWYNAEGEKVTTIEKGTTGNLALEARWLEPVEISSVADFLEFRQTAEPVGIYKLTADLDLTGVTLEAPLAVLGANAIFDGQGHVIKNASYTEAGAKTGLLCASVNGGTVTNVKFLGCAVSSANESAGIVAGTVEGASTLSKIEFNSCSVATTGNYAGLLFGRNEKGNANITINEVTAKNGCTTACSAYGGFLMGDMQTTSKVSFKNLDVAGELQNSTQNASFIAGRTRGGEVSVENAIISAKMPTGITSMGIFSANGSVTKLTIKNVLILESNLTNLYQASKPPVATDITGLYAVAGVTVDQATAGENTVAFLTDTLGFDFTATWVTEGENNAKYRLASASTNVKSADAVITNIKVSSGNAKTRFKKGEEFVASGLNVMASYSDGVQLVLKLDDSVGATDGYVVDYSEFIANVAGTYTIMVKSNEDATKVATYEVTVVEQTDFVVIDEFMTHTYLVGAKLDTANLVVKSVWSDGVEEKLSAKDFTVGGTYDMNTVGEQTVLISNGDFGSKPITISVVNSKPVPVDGKVYVNVDATSAVPNGTKVNGVETFKTLTDAIDYLEACKLDASVSKVLYVAEGTYTEKITTDLANLVLVGEGTDKSVLTYSAVESTVDPVSGSQYGLKGATLQVNGEGFRAYNIAIRNDFDYKNDYKKESSPQGLALTINGDQAVLQNVYLYGNQDTLYLKSGRTYIKDSRIDGNIDFIFGEAKGLAYFDNCTIVAISKYNTPDTNNGYVTAMKATDADKPDYGYIFANCTFTDDGTLLEGSMSLGRPWGAKATVAYINCSFSSAYSKLGYTSDDKTKSRWFSMSGNSPVNADFCEYGSTGDGAITEAVDGGRILTDAEVANYTKANIFASTNGLCTWASAWDCDEAVTALAELTGATVAPTGLYVSAETIEVEAGQTTDLYLGVAPWNANDKEVTVTVADEAIATWANGTLTGVAEGTTTITVSKDGLESKTVSVKVTPAQAPVGATYTFTYGAENGAEWITTATATNASTDTTPVTGLKILDTDSFSLTASGKKATITLNGFTTATSKAMEYVTVTFKDAGGNVLGTLTGTTTAGKVVGDFTFTANGIFESETAFATIEISCNTAGKHFSIVSVSIAVE